jgi:hypothetical protein
MNKDPNIQQLFKGLTRAAIALLAIILLGIGAAFFVAFYGGASPENSSPEAALASAPLASEIVDGKDHSTGFVVDEGFEIVKTTCTACHSSDIVLQNKFTREGWKAKIVWMQETQGLWDLGDNEAIILDYLAKHHAPAPPTGRRVPLKDIEWYDLND